MIARASSGSSSSINSVEPLISANSAVTVLRSPASAAEASIHSAVIGVSGVLRGDAGECSPALLAERAVPQSPQKPLPGGFSAPHLGQGFASGVPQSPQNFLSAGLSLPHFEQRIGSPGVKRFASHLPPPHRRDYRAAQS